MTAHMPWFDQWGNSYPLADLLAAWPREYLRSTRHNTEELRHEVIKNGLFRDTAFLHSLRSRPIRLERVS